MLNNLAAQFIEALSKVESGENVESMVDLFSEECEIGNVTLTETLRGKDGVREFWTGYQKTLGTVRSTFKNRIIGDSEIALEWTTLSEPRAEASITYGGVSIIEYEGQRIRRFFAYFDPFKLGHEIGT